MAGPNISSFNGPTPNSSNSSQGQAVLLNPGTQVATVSTDAQQNVLISSGNQLPPYALSRKKWAPARSLTSPIRQKYPLSNVSTTTLTTTGSVSAATNPVLPLNAATGISLGTILEVTQSDGTPFRGHVTAINTLNFTMTGTSTATIASGATITVWGVSVTTSATIANPQFQSAVLVAGAYSQVASAPWTDISGGTPVQRGQTYPDYNFVGNLDVTSGAGATLAGSIIHKGCIHTGSAIELYIKGVTSALSIKIDDYYMNFDVYPMPNDGGLYHVYIPFGSVADRRIEINCAAFGGAWIGPNDKIRPAPIRGPKACIVGDSFTQGTGASGPFNALARWFADYMGWDSVTPLGAGGEGYLSTGIPGITLRQRLQHDVIAPGYDVVIVLMGHNDAGAFSLSSLQAEATAVFQTIQAGLPNAVIIAGGPMPSAGVSGLDTVGNWPNVNTAIKNAAQVCGVYFCSLLQMPFPSWYTPVTSTLAANTVVPFAFTGTVSGTVLTVTSTQSGTPVVGYTIALAGVPAGTTISSLGTYSGGVGTINLSASGTVATASTGVAGQTFISANAPFPPGATLQIDNEYVVVKSTTGGGPYTTTIYDATKAQHLSGATVTQVGDCILTGFGSTYNASQAGTGLTGFGNSDISIGPDRVHPTDYGHRLYGTGWAQQISALGIF